MQKGQTRGRVANIFGIARFYIKPSLRKLVIRKAGVIRTSDAVISRNKKVAAAKPAAACKGKHFYDGSMQACLREQMTKV